MKQPMEIEIQIGEEYVTRQAIELENAGHERLSPYDIPRYARIWHDVRESRLHLEFRYLTPDEPKEEFKNDRISLKLGRMSKKFYSLSVSNVGPTFEEFKTALEEIVAVFRKNREQFNVKSIKERMPYWNFSLAGDFVASKENDLLIELAAAG
jgi:hypothetical protein